MRMDLRFALVLLSLLAAACGKQRTSSSVFAQTKPECVGNAVPNRFIVQYLDGRREVVAADSEQAFLDGFLTEHLDEVDYAEHDSVVKLNAGMPSVSPSAGFNNNWGQVRVDASSLWSAGVRGAGVIVAVVDSGMDVEHVQLRDQLAVNPGETGLDAQGRDKATNGIDDDHNGFVDDVRGFDFIARKPLEGDYAFHGTHVSGIIAAKHSDTAAGAQSYVEGMAPQAKLLPLAFLSEDTGLISDAVDAIGYAVSRGAKIINASWGGEDCTVSLKQTIAGLHAKGVLFVNAAGNESRNIDQRPIFPAALGLPAQITVGSVSQGDHMSAFSNYGSLHVQLFAPGGEIISTYPGDRMASLSGTSMASPMVAGAAALLWSAEPSASADQIRQALMGSVLKRGEYLNATQGRLQLTSALAELRRLMSQPE